MPPHNTTSSLFTRLGWLLACVGGGWLAGFAGSALTADDRWYLAIPAAIAGGWLFLADPSKCDTGQGACRNRPPE